MPRIPLFDPMPAVARDRDRLREAFERVLDGGVYILGPAVEAFEERLRAQLGGGGQVVGVASGSDALELALRAHGVGPGQAVAAPAFSFVATVEAIALTGAVPLFADIDERALLDLDALDASLDALPTIGGQPRLPSGEVVTALVAVHLFGGILDGDALRGVARRHRLRLIEDTAQALGGFSRSGRAGAQGDAGCFSFFPSKTLGAFGDGGAVWAREPSAAERLRTLRQHGQPGRGRPSIEVGRNSRLDALQAALLSVKLDRLDDDVAERRALLGRYARALAPAAPRVEPLWPEPGPGHAAQQMVARCRSRDALASWLAERGVGTAVYYPQPLHHLVPYRSAPRLGPLPAAERAATELLALPLYPGLPTESVDEVARCVIAFGEAPS